MTLRSARKRSPAALFLCSVRTSWYQYNVLIITFARGTGSAAWAHYTLDESGNEAMFSGVITSYVVVDRIDKIFHDDQAAPVILKNLVNPV